MNGRSGPAIGTAFHPRVEPDRGGGGRSSGFPVQLARLPRRRRPGMIALAVALVGAGILGGAFFYTATSRLVPVLVVTATVPAGAVIQATAVGTAEVSAGPGVQVIPASQLNQVIGQIAGTTLRPGMLLTAAELTTFRPPAPGQVLVALPIKPSGLPASGLAPGDRVLVVATPGVQGEAASSSAPPSLTSPVPGVVEAVSQLPGAEGDQVVDVIVAAGNGVAVAEQVSSGQFALVLTKRG